jgi:hypothetical protein
MKESLVGTDAEMILEKGFEPAMERQYKLSLNDQTKDLYG